MDSRGLLLTSEHVHAHLDRDLRRRHASGELVRVTVGTYIPAVAWRTLTRTDRYRLRVIAESLRHPAEQFSRESAAVMWGLPHLDGWPERAQVSADRATGGRSSRSIQRFCVGVDPNGKAIDGVPVTSLPRTLAELACGRSLARSVVALDAGLATVGRGAIRDELDALGRIPGFARARTAIEFADPRAASPGESLCRVQFGLLGVPPPRLQVEFKDATGTIGAVDFYWPEFDLVAEFDGDVKYGENRQFQRNLTPQQVLVAEKRREDRLRRVVRSVARIDWATARDRRALAALLAFHGLR